MRTNSQERFQLDIQRFGEEQTNDELVAKLRAITATETPQESAQETDPTEDTTPNETEVPATSEEVIDQPEEITAENFDQINYNDLPDELKPAYKNMEKLMQKKSQAFSNETKEAQRMNAELAAKVAALEEIVRNPQKASPTSGIEAVGDRARALAMQMLDIQDPADFVPDPTGLLGNKTHFDAYQMALGHIANEQVQHRIVWDEGAKMAQMAKDDPTLEPRFDEAMYNLVTQGEEGRKQFQKVFAAKQRFIQSAATLEDIQVMKAHAAKLTTPQIPQRKAVVVKEKSTPNKVEASGNGISEEPLSLDKAAFRDGTMDDKVAMFRKLREAGQV